MAIPDIRVSAVSAGSAARHPCQIARRERLSQEHRRRARCTMRITRAAHAVDGTCITGSNSHSGVALHDLTQQVPPAEQQSSVHQPQPRPLDDKIYGTGTCTFCPSANAAALAVRMSSVPSRPETISMSAADRIPVCTGLRRIVPSAVTVTHKD